MTSENDSPETVDSSQTSVEELNLRENFKNKKK